MPGKIKEEKMNCPDCKIPMELIIPDDSENYYKCHKCGVEIAEGEEV